MINERKPVRLRLPNAPAVEAYLQNKGWARVTPTDPSKVNPNVLVYRGGRDVEGEPLTVTLPARPDLIDAKRRVSEVVRYLATLEAKSPSDMAREIMLRDRSGATVASRGRGLRGVIRVGLTIPLKSKNGDKATEVTT